MSKGPVAIGIPLGRDKLGDRKDDKPLLYTDVHRYHADERRLKVSFEC
jgi:hypothetical protein